MSRELFDDEFYELMESLARSVARAWEDAGARPLTESEKLRLKELLTDFLSDKDKEP